MKILSDTRFCVWNVLLYILAVHVETVHCRPLNLPGDKKWKIVGENRGVRGIFLTQDADGFAEHSRCTDLKVLPMINFEHRVLRIESTAVQMCARESIEVVSR